MESIIGKGRDSHGEDIYKVKWKGYPDSEATWEPLENLIQVKYMIDSFNKQHDSTIN